MATEHECASRRPMAYTMCDTDFYGDMGLSSFAFEMDDFEISGIDGTESDGLRSPHNGEMKSICRQVAPGHVHIEVKVHWRDVSPTNVDIAADATSMWGNAKQPGFCTEVSVKATHGKILESSFV